MSKNGISEYMNKKQTQATFNLGSSNLAQMISWPSPIATHVVPDTKREETKLNEAKKGPLLGQPLVDFHSPEAASHVAADCSACRIACDVKNGN